MTMTGNRTSHLKRLVSGVIVSLLALGCGMGVSAAWSGILSRWQIADLFFDVGLLVTMVSRGGSLLRS